MAGRILIDKLLRAGALERTEWIELLSVWREEDRDYAAELARQVSQLYFGNKIYVRGLIEFSNCCKNDCYYCGIRRSNQKAQRYRLSKEEILRCCETGYSLGFRTFVLQSGEEGPEADLETAGLVADIKSAYPDSAVTLSLGEKSRETYEMFFKAGADRYLLRHETAESAHYAMLHPPVMSLDNRKRCLRDLKDIGFQTGCGFMVGSPYQTAESLAEDMIFIRELSPHMVGIGPFIPHGDTPFSGKPAGSLELTLFLLSLVRIMLKNVLLPATTALGTLNLTGREQGILAGANVVMPNLSPKAVCKKYSLYDNKIYTGDEAAEGRSRLESRLRAIGYETVTSRGDWSPESK